MTEPGVVTSQLLWWGTLVAALIDIPLLILVALRVGSGLFGKLQGYLAAAAFLVFASIWYVCGSLYFWDPVYRLVFPVWSRWLLPLFFGLLEGVLALIFWRLGRLASRGQALWFILCGGLASLVGHGVGIRRGLMQVPMLAGASAASALVFGIFEFIFYWSVILGLGLAFRGLGLKLRRKSG
jgi:hypothetical protein